MKRGWKRNMNKTILIVDDEPRTREGIRKTLETGLKGDISVLCSNSAREAAAVMEAEQVHLLITDVRMPEETGLELIQNIRHKGQKPVVIVISGHAVFEYAQDAIRLGVVHYLLKPLEKRQLLEAVREALEVERDRERVTAMEKIVDGSLLELNAAGPRLQPPVREAMRYVKENLQLPLGLKEVAEHVHLNASYFSYLFKEQTGQTFSEYATRCRIQKAKELLAGTTLAVADISEQVGYQTVKYFIKVFKELSGMSPSRYRRGPGQDDGREET
jgi:two-component system, response regulator YesN